MGVQPPGPGAGRNPLCAPGPHSTHRPLAEESWGSRRAGTDSVQGSHVACCDVYCPMSKDIRAGIQSLFLLGGGSIIDQTDIFPVWR